MIQMWIYVISVKLVSQGLMSKNISMICRYLYDVDASSIEGGIALKIFVEIYKFTCGNNFFFEMLANSSLTGSLENS